MIDTSRPGWLRELRAGSGAGAVVTYGGAGLSTGARELTRVERALVCGVTRQDGRPPVVCLIPTAGGDDEATIHAFREAFGDEGAEPHVLSLFARTPAPFANVLDRTDLVYVTGGAVANLATLWRLHGLDAEVVALWRRGVPVAGSSAGALIWSSGGVTTSFGSPAAWRGGLRLFGRSVCPHYDTQPERAQLYRECVRTGELPAGLGLDESAAAVLCDDEVVATLSDDDASARVHEVTTDGSVAL